MNVVVLVMGPSLSRARPGARARHFEKGPGSNQARARLFEKGPENWSFYGVKIRGSSRLGLDFFRRAYARDRLELGPGS